MLCVFFLRPRSSSTYLIPPLSWESDRPPFLPTDSVPLSSRVYAYTYLFLAFPLLDLVLLRSSPLGVSCSLSLSLSKTNQKKLVEPNILVVLLCPPLSLSFAAPLSCHSSSHDGASLDDILNPTQIRPFLSSPNPKVVIEGLG